jgi:hypothetical protein
MLLNIGMLFKLKAPDWQASYCRQPINLKS